MAYGHDINRQTERMTIQERIQYRPTPGAFGRNTKTAGADGERHPSLAGARRRRRLGALHELFRDNSGTAIAGAPARRRRAPAIFDIAVRPSRHETLRDTKKHESILQAVGPHNDIPVASICVVENERQFNDGEGAKVWQEHRTYVGEASCLLSNQKRTDLSNARYLFEI